MLLTPDSPLRPATSSDRKGSLRRSTTASSRGDPSWPVEARTGAGSWSSFVDRRRSRRTGGRTSSRRELLPTSYGTSPRRTRADRADRAGRVDDEIARSTAVTPEAGAATPGGCAAPVLPPPSSRNIRADVTDLAARAGVRWLRHVGRSRSTGSGRSRTPDRRHGGSHG